MRDTDLAEFRHLLADALAYWRQDVSEFTLGVWWEACSRYSLEQVSKALNRHARNPTRGAFAPMVADIVRELEGTDTDSALLAWGAVLGAMRSEGAYRSVVFDSAATHAAVEDLGGWVAICRSSIDELPHLQRRFCEAWRTYSSRGAAVWAPVLIGEHEAANRLNGKPLAPPVLIGDMERCKAVMRGPAEAALIAARAMPALESA